MRPDSRVALCVERSPALVIGLLAILKAGGAYLPLDPAYPPERLAYILADADPAIVLADAAGRAALGHAALDGRRLLDPDALPEHPASNPVVPGLTSRHLAYVIYTSGSTGKPKGVMVEHRGNVVFGGEALEPSILQSWYLFQALAEHHVVFNAYGPTESTVCATLWRCPPGFTGETIPIGKPIANTRIYLLDAHGQPVPLGAVGELHIGGDGLARGYLNRPELTAERFLDDPFDPRPGARMYRSGDLARYLPDGNIVFLGRNDHQVKIRGFRIELGEIEARLAAHSAVREAVVLAIGEAADKRLVAYVVAGHDPLLAGALRDHLTAQLPDYMVPAAFVRLDALPLTPNGKLDSRALPAPDQAALASQAYEAPEGETECALAAIWAELLEVERVGRHDSFFALGGHSLLAVRLIEELRKAFGVKFHLATLYQQPLLAQLADALISLQIAQYADGDIEDLEQELGSLSDDDLLKILSAGT